MKKIIFSLALTCLTFIGISQTDTLYTLKRQKIPCKIYELSDTEIKYRVSYSDGPVIVTDKINFYKYVLANGYTEIIATNDLYPGYNPIETQTQSQVIKIHPFCFANNQVSLSYEKIIKSEVHLDIEGGYINSSINEFPLFGENFNQKSFNSGMYIKPGIKFMLKPTYITKGMRYSHPLKGNYVKLDIALSMINFKDVQNFVFTQGPNGPGYSVVYSDVNTFAYGGFVNFGNQTVLANMLTLDFYGGFGFTAQSNSFSNQAFNSSANFTNADGARIYNYHSFLRVPYVGLSFTGGFRIGYIIPEQGNRKSKVFKN